MARIVLQRSGGPLSKEGLAPEAWLVLESRRKGLRSEWTAWGPHRRPQETPLRTAFI